MQTTSYLYRPVLKRALLTTRKFKNLWFFGLFAVLVSAGGEYEILSRAFYNNADEGGLINTFLLSFQSGWQQGLLAADGAFWHNLWLLITSNPAAIITTLFVLLFLITLTLFIVWLAVASQIALIKGCSLAAKNKKLPLGEGLDYANRNFWPVLGIVAILKISLFVLFGILSWELMLLVGIGWLGVLVYILSFIIFIAAVLMISFILKYQTFYLLLKRQKFFTALKSARELFKRNWLISLEMALIMFGIYLLATVVSALLITFFAGVPLVVIPFYLFALPAALKILFSGLAVVCMVLGVLLVTAVMTVFQWAGWTALFEQLAGDEESTSKLERWGENLRQLPDVIMGRN